MYSSFTGSSTDRRCVKTEKSNCEPCELRLERKSSHESFAYVLYHFIHGHERCAIRSLLVCRRRRRILYAPPCEGDPVEHCIRLPPAFLHKSRCKMRSPIKRQSWWTHTWKSRTCTSPFRFDILLPSGLSRIGKWANWGVGRFKQA